MLLCIKLDFENYNNLGVVKIFCLCVDSIDRNNFKVLYFLCELGLEEVDVFGYV